MNKEGLALVEVALGLGLVALFISVLHPSGIQAITNARLVQNRNDLDVIGQACQQYYMGLGRWPVKVGDLQPYFLSAEIDGASYTLNPQPNILIISLGPNSTVVVKPRGLAWRLDYKVF